MNDNMVIKSTQNVRWTWLKKNLFKSNLIIIMSGINQITPTFTFTNTTPICGNSLLLSYLNFVSVSAKFLLSCFSHVIN